MPEPSLLYLSAADVMASMPPTEERLRLAERTLVALSDGSADLPAKIGVGPRWPSSFGHAMPAFLRGEATDGTADLLGMKWIVGFPTNVERGLPALSAVVVLSDAIDGGPRAILDGGPITAARTAAVSGVAIRHFAPLVTGRPHRVGLIGAGIQGQAHLAVIGHVLPGAELAVFDRDPERAGGLARVASGTGGIASVRLATDARDCVRDADVVITAASFGPVRQVLTNDWLGPDALVVPIDYATYCAAEVARDAALFLVDEVGQFVANRQAGNFDDYPDPAMTIGAAIAAGVERPANGRVITTHLGTGLADLVFGDAVVRAALATGLGIQLSR